MNGYVVKEDMHMWNKMCDIYYSIQKIIPGSLKNIEKKQVLVKTIAKFGKTGGLTG